MAHKHRPSPRESKHSQSSGESSYIPKEAIDQLRDLFTRGPVDRYPWVSQSPAEPPGDSSGAGGKQKGRYYFEFAEHGRIGNDTKLKGLGPDGGPISADREIILEVTGGETIDGKKSAKLSYGQISALSGDYYGTYHAISSGGGSEQQEALFMEAFSTLANNEQDQPADVLRILDFLNGEVKAIDDALRNGNDPSDIYGKHEELTSAESLQKITSKRKNPHLPSYLALALVNQDHFGMAAVAAYTIGHRLAIQRAKRDKSKENLRYAYAMNAYADHFLQDLFSAGHLRTPRYAMYARDLPLNKKLEELVESKVSGFIAGLWKDLATKFMHDEDSAIGLYVTNKKGEDWTCYGDKRLGDKVNAENAARCNAAVQASADEVYNAWQNPDEPDPDHFAFVDKIPYVKPEKSQPLKPLFRVETNLEGDPWDRTSMRYEWDNRRSEERTLNWSFHNVTAMYLSSKFTYPIRLDN